MKPNPLFAYVGSYTSPQRNGRGNGINVYRVDPRTGAFRHVQHLGGLENPSFLALNANGTRLYSVHGDRSEATSYTVDRQLWLANIATQRLDSIGALEGYSVNKRRFSTLLP